MRRLIFALLALAAACAQPIYRPVAEPAPVSPPERIALAGGPEGESPAYTPGERTSRPSLATAVMEPSARIAIALDRLREKQLVIPVAGVGPSRIEDTFSAGRDGGERQHNAVDILAPRNTPVIAADDGMILRMSTNALGGITIYAADRDQAFVYYYAHLDHYQRGVSPGQSIQKGDTLGFVGTTGNAPKDVPHLHFQIMIWPSDGKWWNGEPVNPFPVLHPTAESTRRRR